MTVGVVAIGRNEGERLKKCLESILRSTNLVVYVDSGSTDDSVALARGMGAEIVELDLKIPFTAARARNQGFKRLIEISPTVTYVQFVDGDCDLSPKWLSTGTEYLQQSEDIAVVSGRLRERFPNFSVYNRLCDMEWDAPVGEAKYCGGNAMMRVAALDAIGGFRDDLIAGEEPELCVRFRAAGWRIWRHSAEMAWHDAAMTKFGQWWRRTQRAGYAYAQGRFLHGKSTEQFRVRESRRIWVWGFLLPMVICGLALAWQVEAIALILIYPAQIARLAILGTRGRRENWLRACFLVIGKFPEMLGQVRFLLHRLIGRQSRLIEYK
jgi:GT2 family glycosyltransferase